MKNTPEELGIKRIPLADLMAGLGEDEKKIISMAKEMATIGFNTHGGIVGMIISMNAEGEPKIRPAIFSNDEEKAMVWEFLRLIRRTNPMVVLVTEAWVLLAKGKETFKKGQPIPRPSDSPDREEVVMITAWFRERKISINAEIFRNPDRLGDFLVWSDSDEPSEVTFGGELTRGDSYQDGGGRRE